MIANVETVAHAVCNVSNLHSTARRRGWGDGGGKCYDPASFLYRFRCAEKQQMIKSVFDVVREAELLRRAESALNGGVQDRGAAIFGGKLLETLAKTVTPGSFLSSCIRRFCSVTRIPSSKDPSQTCRLAKMYPSSIPISSLTCTLFSLPERGKKGLRYHSFKLTR